ncbi:MAG: hypothetical protein L6R48_23435 [Planctomycetes bacterium]|nr:hypothetical protein [Planctomycetota bacterium]
MRIAALLITGLFTVAVTAADTPLIDGGVEAFAEVWAGGLDKSLVEAPTQGGKALKLVVSEKPEQPWGAQTWVTPIKADIATGDTVQIKLSARCLAPAGQSGQLSVSIGLNAEPWTQTVAEKLEIGNEWKEYTVTGVAAASLSAAAGRVGFLAGYQIQTIEIAKITVLDLGKK